MSYERVIPRDLFNDGNLLKCYGQIYLNLEKLQAQGVDAALEEDGIGHDGLDGNFNIEQDRSDGSTWVFNLALFVRGRRIKLRRPLNARRPFPLWCYPDDDTEIAVFDDDGNFTNEMLTFLKSSD